MRRSSAFAIRTGGGCSRSIENFAIPAERVFLDIEDCVQETKPDLAILCPATARHAEVVEQVAPLGTDILLEKPFAASLADADRILAAVRKAGVRLAVNWPLRWYPPHVTTKRLLDEGLIGEPIEVHFYDGNRGPLYHRADKVVVSDEEVRREKLVSWWYTQAAGGGSLLDYLGYGATLGTWFMKGEAPVEVTSVVDQSEGLEVDEHSITVCRYRRGLSKLETRWGTFTDPWKLQPQPKCGFVLVGTDGTISSYDYEDRVSVQTRSRPEIHAVPADALKAPFRSSVEYVLQCKEKGLPFEGPLDPALCRTAQRIVDTAALSARERRTLALLP
jgi:predicted dehydrogenase